MKAEPTLNIGILGTGTMATAIGRLLAAEGHAVRFGSRDPERARRRAAEIGGTASGGGYREAAAHGEVVVLAALWQDAEEILRQAGSLDGKVLLDCSNPEGEDGRSLAVGHLSSGAEEISRWAPGARVVKAFNHVYAELLDAGPRFGAQPASVFYCSDDPAAKATVAALGAAAGFEMVDAGVLANARYLEPIAMLMVQLVRVLGMAPADVALKLLRR
jgi:8-hydroxy-5-deazaflavin:NADPH oxidoreductase